MPFLALNASRHQRGRVMHQPYIIKKRSLFTQKHSTWNSCYTRRLSSTWSLSSFILLSCTSITGKKTFRVRTSSDQTPSTLTTRPSTQKNVVPQLVMGITLFSFVRVVWTLARLLVTADQDCYRLRQVCTPLKLLQLKLSYTVGFRSLASFVKHTLSCTESNLNFFL